MGPKKQAAKQGDDEDLSTKELLSQYKRFSKDLEIQMFKPLETKLTEILEEGGKHLNEILINEKIGEFGARALFNALKAVNQGNGYKHLVAIRIWDGDIGDEGVRAFYQFIIDTNNTSVILVEFLNCGIGSLGCEFISRIFDKNRTSKISVLTLDYNNFGNEGFAQLMENLKDSKTLTYLSLAYCGIDENGVKYLSDYLSTKEINLEKLVLQGNPIKNVGMSELLKVLLENSSIEEINLNNVLFGNNIDVMKELVYLMQENTNILAYSFKFNFINDQDFEIILRDGLKQEGCKHIYQFSIDEKISKPLFDEFYKLMKTRKKPKKKAAKKGGKKK